MKKAIKTVKKALVMFALAVIMVLPFVGNSVSAGGAYKDFGSGYTARLDNPGDDGKPYYHIHFYYKGSQVYCLRLDTLQPCDGFNSNPLPKWVMKDAKKWQSSRWGYEIDSSTISWGKWLAVIGLGIVAIILTICPFDGPAGDAVAWGLLLGTI